MRITRHDILHWADRIDARHRLPVLIRRLIHATSRVIRIDFPGDEGVQKHGADGILLTESRCPYVPDGASIWELSVEKGPKSKADKDYKSRKKSASDPKNPNVQDHGNLTYVAVTARSWTKRRDWEQQRRAEGFWKDVYAIDVDIIAQWLELAPSAAAWFCEEIGLPTAVSSLDSYWKTWSYETRPALNEAIVLGGRNDAVVAIHQFLQGAPTELAVVAPEASEVPAFVWSAIKYRAPSASPEAEPNDRFLARSVVAHDASELESVARQSYPIIIVALSITPGAARSAAERGHHVLWWTDQPQSGRHIELGEMDRGVVATLLPQIGIEPRRAGELVDQSRGMLVHLRNSLELTKSSLDKELAPLLLFAAWDERNSHDVELILRVTRKSQAELNKIIRENSTGAGAPLSIDGSMWKWTSRRSAWVGLSRQLLPIDIREWKSEVVRIFQLVDPRFDLPSDERWLATIKDKTPPYSRELREGLVETLELLAINRGTDLKFDGRHEAEDIVRSILRSLTSWTQWATLEFELPRFTEVAPSIVIAEIRTRLDRKDMSLLEALAAVEHGGLGVRRQFDGVRRAMEILAWSDEHLHDAVFVLGAIQSVASKNNQYQGALSSLVEIFLPWHPHTNADFDRRTEALRNLSQRFPDVAFALLLRLLPDQTRASLGTAMPQLSIPGRSSQWKATNDSARITQREFAETNRFIGDVLLRLVGQDARRWIDLLPVIHHLWRPQHFDDAMTILSVLDLQSIVHGDLLAIHSALRTVLCRHRRVKNADWTLKSSELEPLQKAYDRIERQLDIAERFAWQFESEVPEFPDNSDYEWEKKIGLADERRKKAACEIWNLPIDEIAKFARTVKQPAALSAALAKMRPDVSKLVELLNRFRGDDSRAARHFRAGVGFGLIDHSSGRISEESILSSFDPVERGQIAVGLPNCEATWDMVEAWGPASANSYWCNIGTWPSPAAKNIPRILASLLSAGRPGFACILASHADQLRSEPPVTSDLYIRILDACAVASFDNGKTDDFLDHYAVGDLLSKIPTSTPESRAERLRLELMWFRILESTGHKATTLFEEMAKEPEFYAEIVGSAYAKDAESARIRTDAERRVAEIALKILLDWEGLPGLGKDGISVDQNRLYHWFHQARKASHDRTNPMVGDHQLGQVLAQSPAGADGRWPHEVVRDLLESLDASSDVESGFVNRRFNLRGVQFVDSQNPHAGDRALAIAYRNDSEAVRSKWPVTARCLDRLARAFDPPVTIPSETDRLRAFIDSKRLRQQFTFSSGEASTAVHLSDSQLVVAAKQLVKDRILAAPAETFFVIVSEDYRSDGSPPATWYIDAWMKHEGQANYYVGLLTASAIHGAGHQQPQVFQVIVDRELPASIIGRSRFEFVVGTNLERRAVREVPTNTGSMRISTPETTAFDLVEKADRCMGIDHVVEVFSELSEVIDPLELAGAAPNYPLEVVQKVGSILESQIGLADLVSVLFESNAKKGFRPLSLRSDGPTKVGEDLDRWCVSSERFPDSNQ